MAEKPVNEQIPEQTASQDEKPILTKSLMVVTIPTHHEWKALVAEWCALQQSVRTDIKIPAEVGLWTLAGLLFSGWLSISVLNFKVDFGLGVALLAASCVTMMGAAALDRRNARTHLFEQELLVYMKQITDLNALGPLIQAFQKTQSRSGRIAMPQIIIGLLERQTRERHAILTEVEQRLLGALLEYGRHLPLTRTNPGRRLPLLDTTEDIQLQRAVLPVLPFLSDQNILPSLARMIARDAPSRRGPAVREEARLVMSAQIATLDFGSVETIPTWIERLPLMRGERAEIAVHGSGWDDCMIAVCALTQLLPRLTTSHGKLIDAQARKRLRNAPRTIPFILGGGLPSNTASRLGPDFTLAVLGALELFGTGEDLPFVRYWANLDIPTSDLTRIRHRARQVVPVLEARQKQEEISQSLLRGSSAPPAPANQLLRPATGHNASEPASELLRPEPVIKSSADGQLKFNTSAPEQVLSLRIESNNASN